MLLPRLPENYPLLPPEMVRMINAAHDAKVAAPDAVGITPTEPARPRGRRRENTMRRPSENTAVESSEVRA